MQLSILLIYIYAIFSLQDVMLSATSTQSPLATISSVFTMPAVSMPNVSLAGSLAGSAICGLPEQLFMSVPGLTDAVDAKHESNGKRHPCKKGMTSILMCVFWGRNFKFQTPITLDLSYIPLIIEIALISIGL